MITLDRQDKRNALHSELCGRLRGAVAAALADGARALVLTGAGTSFCSGADLDAAYSPEFREALYGMLHAVADAPIPVVAAVNGPAIGAGTQLAIAADLRVAAPGAVFAVPTVKLGPGRRPVDDPPARAVRRPPGRAGPAAGRRAAGCGRGPGVRAGAAPRRADRRDRLGGAADRVRAADRRLLQAGAQRAGDAGCGRRAAGRRVRGLLVQRDLRRGGRPGPNAARRSSAAADRPRLHTPAVTPGR